MAQKRSFAKRKPDLSKVTFHQLDWLEWIALGTGIWFIIFPKPYLLLFTVLLCMPFIGMVLNGLKGRPSIASLVQITRNDKGEDKYDVADFIDFPAWALLIRVLIDFEFESFYSLILPVSIGFALLVLILLATHRAIVQTPKSKLWIYGSLFFNILLFSYGATYGANCAYDTSSPQVYHAHVVGKHISKHRKGPDTYYVRVTPWGHHHDPEDISVPASRYGEIAIGQTVSIDLKQGLFGIKWYYIE